MLVLLAAFGGLERGEIGGTAPAPPVKGLAAPCIPARSVKNRQKDVFYDYQANPHALVIPVGASTNLLIHLLLHRFVVFY